jgi:hypothetical protein
LESITLSRARPVKSNLSHQGATSMSTLPSLHKATKRTRKTSSERNNLKAVSKIIKTK